MMTAPQDPFAAPGQPGGTPAGSPQPPQEQGGPGYGGPSGGGPGYGGAGAPAPAYGSAGGYPSAQAGPRNGFGLTALITGIVGLLFGVLPFTFYLGIILGLVAVVFALLGRRRAKRGEATNGGQALAGLICGALALLAGIAWTAALTIFLSNHLHHCPPGYRTSQGTPETYSTSC